jgi:hypothetical protein
MGSMRNLSSLFCSSQFLVAVFIKHKIIFQG